MTVSSRPVGVVSARVVSARVGLGATQEVGEGGVHLVLRGRSGAALHIRQDVVKVGRGRREIGVGPAGVAEVGATGGLQRGKSAASHPVDGRNSSPTSPANVFSAGPPRRRRRTVSANATAWGR